MLTRLSCLEENIFMRHAHKGYVEVFMAKSSLNSILC